MIDVSDEHGDEPTASAPARPNGAALLAGLNPVQHEAVSAPDGPILVVAGAGSGKTRVLTHRIAYLITERRVSPFGLLAITFTNKAAGEMKERVASLVGPVAHKMWVSTFHSACSRILRRDAPVMGYRSSFSIYDQADAVRLTEYVRRDLNLDPKRFPPRRLHAAISAMKNELVTAEEAVERAFTPPEKRIAEVYVEYQKRLLEASALDFDDLLTQTVRLFKEHPEVLARWRGRFHHVLVDEFQDTNVAQWELVRMLTEEHRNVMVVGDTDQSIYKFRGADFRNLMRFEEEYPDATVFVLEQNYRSSQHILDAANAVIANNAARRPKQLWTEQVGGELITRYHAEDEHDEAVVRRARDAAARRHREHAALRRRGLLPHQRAEPRARGAARARGCVVPRGRRREVLRPARGEGHPRLPARAGEPRRRGELASCRQHTEARGRRHVGEPGRGVRAGRGPHVPRRARARRRRRRQRQGARRASATCSS